MTSSGLSANSTFTGVNCAVISRYFYDCKDSLLTHITQGEQPALVGCT